MKRIQGEYSKDHRNSRWSKNPKRSIFKVSLLIFKEDNVEVMKVCSKQIRRGPFYLGRSYKFNTKKRNKWIVIEETHPRRRWFETKQFAEATQFIVLFFQLCFEMHGKIIRHWLLQSFSFAVYHKSLVMVEFLYILNSFYFLSVYVCSENAFFPSFSGSAGSTCGIMDSINQWEFG